MKRLALVLLLAALYLPALGSSASGTHPDESYYLGISAEMDQQGAWLTPTLDGQPKWFKPPLLYWAQRLAYSALGRGFFGGRLPVALSAIALALVTGALARRMCGRETEVPAVLLTATLFGWLKFGRLAMMDAPMALAFTAAAYGVWRASEEDAPRQLLWAGIAAGAAFMLKGPVGAVLVLLIAGGFLAVRRPRLLASRWTMAAFGVGAAIGLPWYVASLLVHGERFYDFFVIAQNVDRFRHPWTASGELVLIVGWLVFLLPWTAIAIAAVPHPRAWREPGVALPLVWIAAVLAVFTVPSLKWPHYGLACAPAAVLLIVRAAPAPWARIATAALLGAGSLASVAVLRWPVPPIVTASLLVVAAALAASAWQLARGRLAAGAALAGVAFAIVLALVIPRVNPEVIPPHPRAALAGRDLYVYDFAPGIFTMGAGRPVRRVERDDIQATLERGGVIIFTAHALSAVPPAVRDRLAAVARWEHVATEVPPGRVLQAWRRGETRPLFEAMLAVELTPASRERVSR